MFNNIILTTLQYIINCNDVAEKYHYNYCAINGPVPVPTW